MGRCLLTTHGIVTLPPRVPREPPAERARGTDPVEAQLRDLAVLAAIVLLFVLTLQVLWLTGSQRPTGRRR